MATLTCPDCGNPFDTVLPAGKDTPGVASLACGRRDCPGGGRGGKPHRTTAKGAAVDDRRAKSGARKATGGYVEQRSTGFGVIDALAGFGRRRRRK